MVDYKRFENIQNSKINNRMVSEEGNPRLKRLDDRQKAKMRRIERNLRISKRIPIEDKIEIRSQDFYYKSDHFSPRVHI